MIMRVVALFATDNGKWARLKTSGKVYYSGPALMTCLDVKDEGYKLGAVLKVTRVVIVEPPQLPTAIIHVPQLEASSGGTQAPSTAQA